MMIKVAFSFLYIVVGRNVRCREKELLAQKLWLDLGIFRENILLICAYIINYFPFGQ